MTDEQKGGIALIAGSAGMLITMAFHPTGHDLFQPGQAGHMAQLAVGVNITWADNPVGGPRVLHLEGPVVLETLFKFRDAIKQETAAKVILDFTQVPYNDSAGLGSMVTALVRFRDTGRALALAGMNAKCKALLQMTNLESTFRIFPTLEEALKQPL